MFIAFDGIDGAGKTSIYKSVAEKLRKNHKVKLFDMGNLGFLDNIIRGMKKGTYKCDAELRECIYYFEGNLFSDRIAKQYLADEKQYILIDRYILSYMSYGPLNGMDINQICDLCENMIWPDYYFFIDTSPVEALRRISTYRKIAKPEIGFKNILSNNENQNQQHFLSYQEQVYSNFRTAIMKSRKSIYIIDNNGNLSQPVSQIMNILESSAQKNEC